MVWPFQIVLVFLFPMAVLGVLIAIKRVADRDPSSERIADRTGTALVVAAVAVVGGTAVHDNHAGGVYARPADAVRDAFALGEAVEVDDVYQAHRAPMCWWPATHVEAKATFPDADAFEAYSARSRDQRALVAHIATYFGVPQDNIDLEAGVLEWGRMDERHSLDGAGKEWPMAHRRYFGGPHACIAIDRVSGADAALSLRACDAQADPPDWGDLGRVVAVLNNRHEMLDVTLSFNGTPASCRRSLRSRFNRLLGIPDSTL